VRIFASGVVLGTAWLQGEAALPLVHLWPVSLALLLAAWRVRGWAPRALLILAAGTVAGYDFAALRAEIRLADALPVAWEGRDIELTGVVCGLPQAGEKGTRFLFCVEQVETQGAHVPATVSLSWYASRWRGEEEGGAPPALRAGERWHLTARLKRPRGLANAHGFDFEPWALERDIRATGYVRAKSAAERREEHVIGWPQSLHRLRGAVREAMNAHLGDAPLAGVLVALAIGDQDAIAQDHWQVFWRTGVGHLVSISGLHITMLAGLAFLVAAFAWVRVPRLALAVPARKAGAVAGVAAALAYSLVAGYSVPTQRTLVMLAVVALCVLADRHTSPSRVLARAVLAVIFLDPWAVLSPGFWLSFGAVGAIFYAVSLRTGRPGAIAGAASTQLAVTLGMLPMLVALFQEVSLVSPLANAFAIPLVSLVVVPLTLAGAFLPVPFALDLAHLVMALTMVPLEWLAGLPDALLESHEPLAWTVACAVAGSLWLLAPRGVPMRSCGAVLFVPLFTLSPAWPQPGAAWIDVLDVGHGLSVVVRTASHALVYDAGPTWSAEADSGSRVVVPFLRGEGVRRLDMLAISHADDDHAGGMASVARLRRPVVLFTTLRANDERHLLAGISRLCMRGVAWDWDGVRFEALHPDAAALDEPRRKENDRGCVLRVATRGAVALLTADVEARSEAELVAREGERLRADVMLIPHHGSKTSSTPAFLDAVAPRLALLPAGYRNRFRHPNPAVMARYAARGVDVWRTDLDGALRVELPADRGGKPAVRGQDAQRRYWTDRTPREPWQSIKGSDPFSPPGEKGSDPFIDCFL
jgi:competence protein ComEC